MMAALRVGLSFYDQNVIVFDGKISVFITENIFVVVFGCVMICVVIEIKSLVNKFLPRDRAFFTLQVLFQDPPVLPQRIVDIAYEIIAIAVLLIVV
jgi:hypothetical protein